MREQLPSMPRVFTGDEIDVAENLERAVRDVCEIADRSGDEIQGAGHVRAYLRRVLDMITGLTRLTR